MYVLVKWSSDWADEFSTDGFLITTKKQWATYTASLTEESISSLYFGTNEGWDGMSVKEYLSSCKVSDISDEERSVLFNLFKHHHLAGWNGKKHTKETDIVAYGIFPLAEDKEEVLWWE